MDIERPPRLYTSQLLHGLPPEPQKTPPYTTTTTASAATTKPSHCQSNKIIQQAVQSFGMPWTSSIDPHYTRDSLFFMPFWQWQIQYMQDHLSNLRLLPTQSSQGHDLTCLQASHNTPLRMHTLQFTCDQYQRIRLTYMDGGVGAQIFTSIWTPHVSGIPLLACELMQFHQVKHVCICDFQPLQGRPLHAYDALLQPIRAAVPSLHGVLQHYNFDASPYFSDHLLVGRWDAKHVDAERLVYDDLFPAYQAYVKAHVHMTPPVTTSSSSNTMDQDLQVYDSYMAQRDPASGYLARHFGKELADEFLHTVMFPRSIRPTAVA
jgi:hypothetical protein